MYNFKPVFLVSCLLLLVLIAGCATIQPRGSTSSSESEKNKVSLSVSSILKFEDIPVPSGFKILDKESFAFQNDRSRVALLKYTGGKPADQVVTFYQEQMGSYNWNLINIVEYERKVMNYENSDESCIITIQPQGWKSTVTIAISPKSRPIKAQKDK